MHEPDRSRFLSEAEREEFEAEKRPMLEQQKEAAAACRAQSFESVMEFRERHQEQVRECKRGPLNFHEGEPAKGRPGKGKEKGKEKG